MSHVCTEENEKRSMSGEAANGMADVPQIYIDYTKEDKHSSVLFFYIYLQKSTKITFLLKGGI